MTETSAAGLALARVAARGVSTGVRPIAGAQAEATGCTCGQTPCQCQGSEFDTEDHLELSPAAESTSSEQLTEEQQQEVEELKQRDAEVREHEQAHLRAAGQYAHGGATYEYTRGPDGQQYATGGEVQIDTTPIANDPDATISKMETVRRAALAPAQPSAQDRRVAAVASQRISEAQAEKRVQPQKDAEREKTAARVERSARVAQTYTSKGTPAARAEHERLDIAA